MAQIENNKIPISIVSSTNNRAFAKTVETTTKLNNNNLANNNNSINGANVSMTEVNILFITVNLRLELDEHKQKYIGSIYF